MKGRQLGLVLVLFSWVAVAVTLNGQAGSAQEALEAARKTAVVDGNLAGAIKQYEAIVTRYEKTDRPAAAQALLQMAECYEKLRSDEAQAAYRRIVTGFQDVPAVAAQAQARIAMMPAGRGATANQQSGSGGRVSMPFTQVRTLDFLDPGPGSYYSVSSGGEYAAYIQWRDESVPNPAGSAGPRLVRGVNRVTIRHLESQFDRTIAESELVPDFQWSPDGKRLALVTEVESSGTFRRELRIVTADTGAVRSIATVERGQASKGWSPVAWSPDGRGIAFTFASIADPADVQLASIDSADVRSLRHRAVWPANLLWSPDGSRLAFRAGDTPSASNDFRILTIRTGTISELVTLPDLEGSPAGCTGDGSCTQLVEWLRPDVVSGFQKSRNTFVRFLAPAGGGATREICRATESDRNSCREALFDGTHLVLRDPAAKRFTVRDVIAGTERSLTHGSGEEEWLTPSPDRRLVAFASNRDGDWALYVVPLDRAPAENPVRIATLDKNPSRHHDARWLGNGLLYFAFAVKDSHLFRLNVDGETGKPVGQPSRLNTDHSEKDHAAVSPDGNQIASWSKTGTRTGISVMTSIGAGERIVLDHPMQGRVGAYEGLWGAPLFWQSAAALLFVDANRRPDLELMRLDLQRGTVEALRHGGGLPRFADGHLSYVALTQEIVYPTHVQRDYDGEIKVRSLIDGSERTIATVRSLYAVAVSSGGQVAYAKAGDPAKGVATELRVVSLDGTDDRVLLSDASASNNYLLCALCPRAWSPNGRFLLYRDRMGRHTMLDVQTRSSWPVLQPDRADWDEATWSPDGSYIVLRRYRLRDEWQTFKGVTYDAVVRLMDRAREPQENTAIGR